MIIRFFRFLLFVGVIYFLYKWFWKGVLQGLKTKNKQQAEKNPNTSTNVPPPHQPPKIIAEMKKDPVCGTYIPENQAVICRVKGITYYFCSEECKLKFQELPG